MSWIVVDTDYVHAGETPSPQCAKGMGPPDSLPRWRALAMDGDRCADVEAGIGMAGTGMGMRTLRGIRIGTEVQRGTEWAQPPTPTPHRQPFRNLWLSGCWGHGLEGGPVHTPIRYVHTPTPILEGAKSPTPTDHDAGRTDGTHLRADRLQPCDGCHGQRGLAGRNERRGWDYPLASVEVRPTMLEVRAQTVFDHDDTLWMQARLPFSKSRVGFDSPGPSTTADGQSRRP